MKGRTPNAAEKSWMAAVSELGCIVCRKEGVFTPCEIHHLDGKTKSGAHLETIGLCALHHRHKDNGANPQWVSRHGDGKFRFERTYGSEAELLNKTRELIEAQTWQRIGCDMIGESF